MIVDGKCPICDMDLKQYVDVLGLGAIALHTQAHMRKEWDKVLNAIGNNSDPAADCPQEIIDAKDSYMESCVALQDLEAYFSTK